MKKPDWFFPDLPPFLAGLTLEHLARLRALVRRHGMRIGVSPRGDVHGLKVRRPVDAFLIVVGSTDDAALLVAPHDGILSDDHAAIAFEPGGEARVVWSPNVALADVLLCLEADTVVLSSQAAKSGKDGPN